MDKTVYKLYKHQQITVDWMQRREEEPTIDGVSGGLVYLTMGLGKTLVSLHHSLRQRRENGELFPTLIVTDKLIMDEWRYSGIEKFFGESVKALYYHREKIGGRFDTIDLASMREYDFVVTTYETCRGAVGVRKEWLDEILVKTAKGKVVEVKQRERPLVFDAEMKGRGCLYAMPWDRIILDESQKMRNPGSKLYRAMLALYGRYKWCVSGTMIVNSDVDLWAHLRFCGYDRVRRASEWKKGKVKMNELSCHSIKFDYDKAQIVMPEIVIHREEVELGAMESGFYRIMLERTRDMYNQIGKDGGSGAGGGGEGVSLESGKRVTFAQVLALFIRLRQICITPELVVGSETGQKLMSTLERNGEIQDVLLTWLQRENLAADSAKLQRILEIIDGIVTSGTDKIVVFSMYSSALRTVERLLKDCMGEVLGPISYIDGSVGGRRRYEILRDFRLDADRRILLVHFKVGGVGLNITEANHVIMLEPWWNGAVHQQAIYRCWRLGQRRDVHVHWVLVKNSIEIPIMQMCQNKDNLAKSYLTGMDFKPVEVKMNKHALGQLLDAN